MNLYSTPTRFGRFNTLVSADTNVTKQQNAPQPQFSGWLDLFRRGENNDEATSSVPTSTDTPKIEVIETDTAYDDVFSPRETLVYRHNLDSEVGGMIEIAYKDGHVERVMPPVGLEDLEDWAKEQKAKNTDIEEIRLAIIQMVPMPEVTTEIRTPFSDSVTLNGTTVKYQFNQELETIFVQTGENTGENSEIQTLRAESAPHYINVNGSHYRLMIDINSGNILFTNHPDYIDLPEEKAQVLIKRHDLYMVNGKQSRLYTNHPVLFQHTATGNKAFIFDDKKNDTSENFTLKVNVSGSEKHYILHTDNNTGKITIQNGNGEVIANVPNTMLYENPAFTLSGKRLRLFGMPKYGLPAVHLLDSGKKKMFHFIEINEKIHEIKATNDHQLFFEDDKGEQYLTSFEEIRNHEYPLYTDNPNSASDDTTVYCYAVNEDTNSYHIFNLNTEESVPIPNRVAKLPMVELDGIPYSINTRSNFAYNRETGEYYSINTDNQMVFNDDKEDVVWNFSADPKQLQITTSDGYEIIKKAYNISEEQTLLPNKSLLIEGASSISGTNLLYPETGTIHTGETTQDKRSGVHIYDVLPDFYKRLYDSLATSSNGIGRFVLNSIKSSFVDNITLPNYLIEYGEQLELQAVQKFIDTTLWPRVEEQILTTGLITPYDKNYISELQTKKAYAPENEPEYPQEKARIEALQQEYMVMFNKLTEKVNKAKLAFNQSLQEKIKAAGGVTNDVQAIIDAILEQEPEQQESIELLIQAAQGEKLVNLEDLPQIDFSSTIADTTQTTPKTKEETA